MNERSSEAQSRNPRCVITDRAEWIRSLASALRDAIKLAAHTSGLSAAAAARGHRARSYSPPQPTVMKRCGDLCS